MKPKPRAVYAAYKEIFGSDKGRIVLQDMMRAHSVLGANFDPDPYVHAELAGEANAVKRVLTILDLSEEEVITLLKES